MPVEMRQRFFEDFFGNDFGVPSRVPELANKIVPRELQKCVKDQTGLRLFVIREK